MTPPLGFSTPPQIPNNTTSKRPPVITTVFAATTPENTPFAYRDYTSANPNPMISPAFVEANYEVLESLLRERRRQIRNEDLRTELEYFSEDYDEEREMKPRPEPHREATLTLRPRSLVVRRQRERVVRFEEAPNREGSRRERNAEDQDLIPQRGQLHQSSTRGVGGYTPRLSPTMAYLHAMGLCSFADSTGSVTPFVRWIEDYPLPGGLKTPSHIGSYDGRGDPYNFLHLLEGSTKEVHKDTLVVHNIKQREGESTRAFVTRYTDDTLQVLGLHEEQRISVFVHGLRIRSLVEHLSTDLPSTYMGLMEKTYTWIEAREVATNETPNDRRENFERARRSSWDNNQGQIIATEKAAKSFE
ncbi:hypothetical protein Tco_0044419 [Tanacetum coccineum]